jgi:putative tryptophan/tyrosine transport system substrate-binding protein
VRRREFITLAGGAVIAWPLAARAQQAGKVVRIGFLGATSPAHYGVRVEALRAGLREFGYIEGTNLVLEYRWAEGNYERLPALVAELIRSNVDVIVTHGTPAALAAKQATASIPIVVGIIGDPVASGVVGSVARPGGNVTGSSFFSPELEAKRLELLKEAMPQLTQVAVLLNPDNPLYAGLAGHAREQMARSLDLHLQEFGVRATNELEGAFENMRRRGAQAVSVADDALLQENVTAIAALANKARLLSIGSKELAQAGAVIGYGIDFVAALHRTAVFVDKILKGSKPGDIPIEQATKFEFVLNLKSAKAIGLEVPTPILLRANEVIE